MKYRYTLLDGMRMGLNVDTGLDISKEQKQMITIFRKLGAVYRDDEYYLLKTGDSNLVLTLRADKNNKKKWYLNISGNPISHFTGQNVYGSPCIDVIVAKTFMRCIEWLESESGHKVPRILSQKVEKHQINIHTFEIALHTKKIEGDLNRLINAWQYMYRASDWLDVMHKDLAQMLNVDDHVHLRKYDNSIGLATLEIQKTQSKDRIYRLLGLCVYRKDKELMTRGLKSSDMKQRLRFDIEFSNRWLNRRRIKTLLDLKKWMEKHHDSWESMAIAEGQKLVADLCLTYMWTCPNIMKIPLPVRWTRGEMNDKIKKQLLILGLNPSISYEAHVAMCEARIREPLRGPDKAEGLKNAAAYKKMNALLGQNMDTHELADVAKQIIFETSEPRT